MSEFRRYYFDSGVFVSFLAKEENRAQVVHDLLKEAHSGRIEIITSSFSLVEVLKTKKHQKIGQEVQEQITAFFEYPFIKLVNADRDICELARKFVWKHSMNPKDAVHMATAQATSKIIEIHGLFSWDDDFIKLNEKTDVKFPISHPFMLQPLLRLEEQSEESTPE
jgi:hypothetical protein